MKSKRLLSKLHCPGILHKCWIFCQNTQIYRSLWNSSSCRSWCTHLMMLRNQKKSFRDFSTLCQWIWWALMVLFISILIVSHNKKLHAYVDFQNGNNFNQTQSSTLSFFLFNFQVSSTDVCGFGTLLLDATRKNKQDFVRLLLEYGLYGFLMTLPKNFVYGWFTFVTYANQGVGFFQAGGWTIFQGKRKMDCFEQMQLSNVDLCCFVLRKNIAK